MPSTQTWVARPQHRHRGVWCRYCQPYCLTMYGQGGSDVSSGNQPKVQCGWGTGAQQELRALLVRSRVDTHIDFESSPRSQTTHKYTGRAQVHNRLGPDLRDLSMSGKPNDCTACFRASASAIFKQAATGTSCRWKCLFWVYLSCIAESKMQRQPQRYCATGSTYSKCTCLQAKIYSCLRNVGGLI